MLASTVTCKLTLPVGRNCVSRSSTLNKMQDGNFYHNRMLSENGFANKRVRRELQQLALTLINLYKYEIQCTCTYMYMHVHVNVHAAVTTVAPKGCEALNIYQSSLVTRVAIATEPCEWEGTIAHRCLKWIGRNLQNINNNRSKRQ